MIDPGEASVEAYSDFTFISLKHPDTLVSALLWKKSNKT
jgi:hypothetical protein